MRDIQGWGPRGVEYPGVTRGRSPGYRAAHYRLQAVQFRQMAEWEPLAAMRQRLLDLARQYDGLAEELDDGPSGPG